MSDTIQGTLHGLLCTDCDVFDVVPDAELLAVRAAKLDHVVAGPADLRTAARRLTEKEFEERSHGAMRARTDRGGAFAFDGYEGGALDVYVRVSRVPMQGRPDGVALDDPGILYLGTYQPVAARDQRGYQLGLAIPRIAWCGYKKAADVWTVFGDVYYCPEGQIERQPIPFARVTALDVDCTQHDLLGSDIADANGFYRIDYPGSRFREGTWLDVELFWGVDYYMRVEAPDGTPLLEEPPSRGRQSDRENSGPCKRIDLCSVVAPPNVLPVAWNRIGELFLIPDSAAQLHHFDAEGHVDDPNAAGDENYALTGNIRLTGTLVYRPGVDDPIRYRYNVSQTTHPNDDGTVGDADFAFSPVLGGGGSAYVNNALLGDLEGIGAHAGKTFEVRLKTAGDATGPADIDASGWIDLDAAIQRAFDAAVADPLNGVGAGDLNQFVYMGDSFATLRTSAFTTPYAPPAGLAAGTHIDAADRMDEQAIALRFDIERDSGSGWTPMPGDGTRLNRMLLNNDGPVALLERTGGLAGCAPVAGSIQMDYTIHHRYLRHASLHVRSNDNSFNHGLSDGGNLPVSGNTSDANNERHGTIPDVAVDAGQSMHRCTYTAHLSIQLRLHTGENGGAASGHTYSSTSFFYEP